MNYLHILRKLLTSLLLVLIAASSHATDITPYKIYKENGRKTSFRKMMKAFKKSQLVLFGELHNSAICHWLQYEASKDLIDSNPDLVLGAEMFESEDQAVLDEFLSDVIDEKALDSLAGLWPNYPTDYAPLVELAKQHTRPFMASNVPRRYASMVYRGGFESLDDLSAEEKAWMAPLPISYDPDLPGYKAMLEMGMSHGGENLPKAQALKDATMGYFISTVMASGKAMIHFNGSYHSDNFEGILHYVLLAAPETTFTTVSSVVQENVHKLETEHIGKATFIICIDENMTPTY